MTGSSGQTGLQVAYVVDSHREQAKRIRGVGGCKEEVKGTRSFSLDDGV